MSVKTLIKTSLLMSEHVLLTYLKDFIDTELYLQPADKANSLAWQLGHLIISENEAIRLLSGDEIELPSGFQIAHSKENSPIPAKQWTLSQYLILFKTQRELTHKYLEELKDQDLGCCAPEKMRSYAPTVADLLLAQSSHVFMHTGQIAVLRRELGKPIVI